MFCYDLEIKENATITVIHIFWRIPKMVLCARYFKWPIPWCRGSIRWGWCKEKSTMTPLPVCCIHAYKLFSNSFLETYSFFIIFLSFTKGLRLSRDQSAWTGLDESDWRANPRTKTISLHLSTLHTFFMTSICTNLLVFIFGEKDQNFSELQIYFICQCLLPLFKIT